MGIYDWREYWSLPETKPPREKQEEALDEIIEALECGYNNILLRGTVGLGKSAIATTLGNIINSSYIVTSTTQLQQQYMDTFPFLTEIKGRRNYTCDMARKLYYESDYHSWKEYIKTHNYTCDNCTIYDINQSDLDWESKLKLIQIQQPDFEIYSEIINNGLAAVEHAVNNLDFSTIYCNCEYIKARKHAFSSSHVVTNYYMLNVLYSYLQFPQKGLIVFDEAHNLERNFINMFKFQINRKTIIKNFGFDIFEDYLIGIEDYSEFIYSDTWTRILQELINDLEYEIKNLQDKKNKTKFDEKHLLKLIQDTNHYRNTITLLNTIQFIPELPPKGVIDNSDKGITTFKPLQIKDFVTPLYDMGEIRLFMSGTISDKDSWCKWNGLDPLDTYLVDISSDIPAAQRPIFKAYDLFNLPKFSGGNYYLKKGWDIKGIKPEIINAIQNIIDKYPEDKGVIQVSSIQDMFFLRKQLDNPYLWTVSSEDNYNNYSRDKIIDCYKKSDKPITLIGRLYDGVDFPDDLCRYNIIFKVPYPPYGDLKYEKIRAEQDRQWYKNETIMPLMQAYGRGVRHDNDYCDTYVMDRCLETELKMSNHLFNDYFLEAVIGNKPRRVPKPIRTTGGK